mgnify:CR=1
MSTFSIDNAALQWYIVTRKIRARHKAQETGQIRARPFEEAENRIVKSCEAMAEA